MKKRKFDIFGKYYDQIYLKMKDYEAEAKTTEDVIGRFEKRQSRTLLDVGCGTGEHLKCFTRNFQCTGVDIDSNMVKAAKRKVPNARFKVANMINFKLNKRFDVIVCLFSAIGYVKSPNNLAKTLENFHLHLNPEGLAIVEPWVFKKDFKKGFVGLDTYEDDELKLARMATSKMVKSQWLVFMHYLLGQKGKIGYFTEIHEMLAADHEDYIQAFEDAGFREITFVKEGLWNGSRGLFIATK